MIRHILLLPHRDTRAALLAPGAPVCCWVRDGKVCVYGWVGPKTRVAWEDGWDDGEDISAFGLIGGCCLVLARDGAVVPEGVDRAHRVTGRRLGPSVVHVLADSHGAWIAALRAEVAPFGTPVLLDESGTEVTP